ncbi:MAG: OsmC family protein [Pseudobdellovibrionaceae bacterium]
MAIQKSGSAHWEGTLKEGKGTVSTESGVLNAQPYGFNIRFGDDKGTNPEELIAAAHASCFSMALSNILGEYDLTAKAIDTKATVTLEKNDGGFAVTKSHLAVNLSVPGADNATLEEAAGKAKAGCPISKLLNAEITMDLNIQSAASAA